MRFEMGDVLVDDLLAHDAVQGIAVTGVTFTTITSPCPSSTVYIVHDLLL